MKDNPITYISLQTYGPNGKDDHRFNSVNIHRGDNARSYMQPTPSSICRVIRAQAKRALQAFEQLKSSGLGW